MPPPRPYRCLAGAQLRIHVVRRGLPLPALWLACARGALPAARLDGGLGARLPLLPHALGQAVQQDLQQCVWEQVFGSSAFL